MGTITKEYIDKLNYGTQDKKRIKFDESDEFNELKFIDELEKYVRKLSLIVNKGEEALVTCYDNRPNISYQIMQEEIDRLYGYLVEGKGNKNNPDGIKKKTMNVLMAYLNKNIH